MVTGYMLQGGRYWVRGGKGYKRRGPVLFLLNLRRGKGGELRVIYVRSDLVIEREKEN